MNNIFFAPSGMWSINIDDFVSFRKKPGLSEQMFLYIAIKNQPVGSTEEHANYQKTGMFSRAEATYTSSSARELQIIYYGTEQINKDLKAFEEFVKSVAK